MRKDGLNDKGQSENKVREVYRYPRPYSLLHPNKIWLAIVLIHIIGSVGVSLAGIIPFGAAGAAALIWISMGVVLGKSIWRYLACAAGWALTIFLFQTLSADLQGSLLLNELLLVYAVWACGREYTVPWEYCPVKRFSPVVFLLAAAAAIFLFAAADYINVCSMLFFQNYLDTSMDNLVDYPVTGLITVAIIPAVVEEFYFRGFIYRGISDKKKAVFVSALLFALLHMNFNQMSYAFFMGLTFGLVVYVTGNLGVTIFMHMLFNGISVILTCFSGTKIIQILQKWTIAGYAPFQPSVTDSAGKVQLQLLAAGGLSFLGCLMAAGGLIRLIGKMSIFKERVRAWDEAANGRNVAGKAVSAPKTDEVGYGQAEWMPDLGFFFGCVLCLLTAVLYEIFL